MKFKFIIILLCSFIICENSHHDSNFESRVNKGWPTGAIKLLNQRDVNILLDKVEISQQKELIAKGYFLANKNKLAI